MKDATQYLKAVAKAAAQLGEPACLVSIGGITVIVPAKP